MSKPEQEAPKPPSETRQENQVWVKTLTDECLDDVITLPPGGASRRPPPDASPEQGRYIPAPDYLSHEGRDLRIDLLRGYFVFAMIVDHVRGASPLYLITGGNRFYASAAEGFILTSGLVAGLVYRRLIQRDGMAQTMLKVLSRAGTLYLLTVAVTLAFSVLSEVFYASWATGINLSDPLGFVVSVLTLHRTYYLIDVMLLYTVLFLVSPMAFILLDRKKTGWLLGGSLLLYGLYQFYPEYASLPWNIEGNYLFNFSAWQVLFFGGLALGYHQERIPALGCRQTRIGLALTGAGLAALIALFFIIDTPTSDMPTTIAATSSMTENIRQWIQDYVFAKVDVRPGRLVASAIVFGFLFFASTHFWKFLRRTVGWLLLPLGQHALNAYTYHIVVVGVVALALSPLKLEYPGPQWLNFLIQAGSVLLIWFLVKNPVLAPTPKTRRYWNLSPAIFAVIILITFMVVPAPSHPGLAAPASQPDNSAVRVPRRYGTPLPKTVKAASEPTPTPQPGQAPGQQPGQAPGQAPAIQPTPIPNPGAATIVTEDPLANERPKTKPGSDIITTPYLGQIDGVVRERVFYSPELDRDMPYYIYLPAEYDRTNRRYPVLYMLHGRGGHREEWIAYGLIDTADREIRNGNILPMIIVLPQGDRGFWVDSIGDGPRWGQYLVRDLVPHIDANFRTLRSPDSRAIGGLSMGAWGALVHAFTSPEVFSVVGAHSISLYRDDGSLPFLGTGDEFNSRDPLYLARNLVFLKKPVIWIDTGEEDEWLQESRTLAQVLMGRGLNPIFQVFPGGHDYRYWDDHVIDYIRFYNNALNKK